MKIEINSTESNYETNSCPKQHREKWPGPLLLLTGLAALACLVGTARGADAVTSNVDVTPPVRQLSGDDWRSISLSAGRILKHVDQAVDALADKKSDLATTNIEKGLTLIKLVDGILPPTIVKTEIKGAGVTYEDEDSITPAYVPIYREYDQVDIVSPVTAQKQQQAASPPAKAGDTITSAADLKNAPTPEYTYAGLDYTGIKLNLRLAKRDLLLAQDSVKQGDAKAATAALQDIQAGGVIFEFSAMREPLVRAMDNLRLAESELGAKHPDQAKAALSGATDALKSYEKLAGDTRSKEVATLQKEIDGATHNLTGETREDFSKKVSAWWDKCLGWFQS